MGISECSVQENPKTDQLERKIKPMKLEKPELPN